MIEIGDIMMVKNLKTIRDMYRGTKVEILKVHMGHNPLLYTCKHLATEKEIALYETELETLWEHDKRMLGMWKEIYNKGDIDTDGQNIFDGLPIKPTCHGRRTDGWAWTWWYLFPKLSDEQIDNIFETGRFYAYGGQPGEPFMNPPFAIHTKRRTLIKYSGGYDV